MKKTCKILLITMSMLLTAILLCSCAEMGFLPNKTETTVNMGKNNSSTGDNSTSEHVHTIVIDSAVAETCGKNGLTEGSHCEVCGDVLVAQEIVPATRQHTYGDNGICTVCAMKKPTEGLIYTLMYTQDSYMVTGIGTASNTTEIVIADTYNGLLVTSIGDYAFDNCSGLTSITIPNSVTWIVDYAFFGCSSLTSITIPDSVTDIGRYAFSGCSGLTSITIPDSVTNIGKYAFSGCSGLTSITIPNSITNIGEYSAFYGCSSLKSITIPKGVTSIGYRAFYGCNNLTIYAEAASKPDGWDSYWNDSNRPVVWGYTPEA